MQMQAGEDTNTRGCNRCKTLPLQGKQRTLTTSNHHNCCDMPTYKTEKYCKNTNLPATATGEPSHPKANLAPGNKNQSASF
jgi:hypothetical protein